MPYRAFLDAAIRERYDIELLGHRFDTGFEQVCHRLTTLRRPRSEGIPFHMVRIDLAGNISKRFSASGIRFGRFSGACPRWTVHAAFLTPGQIVAQIGRMPDGMAFLCVARTIRREGAGYRSASPIYSISIGSPLEHASEMVYSDSFNLTSSQAEVPIGITCRTCERMDCEQRAFPAIPFPFEVDENVRGLSFYAPITPLEDGPPSPG